MTTQSGNQLQSKLSIRRITPKDTVSLQQHSVLFADPPESDVLLQDDYGGKHHGAFLFLEGVFELIAVVSVFDKAFQQVTPDREAGCVPALRFEKFACDPRYRHQGIGTRLLQHVFNDAISDSQTPALVVWCDARIDAAEWFEREDIGMERSGETFIKGRLEYVRMKRVLIAGPGVEVHDCSEESGSIP